MPLIYAFSDGAKSLADAPMIEAVRAQLRAVDWAEVHLCERDRNFGLGPNVLAGVTEVAAKHDAFIAWEDDLVCVPGTYAWVSAALRHYADVANVFSVSAWNHPSVIPGDVRRAAYFDGRAECWVWGGYARAWGGMDQSAREKMRDAARRGVAADAYGSDLPTMARAEARKNVWAVRWLYHHLQNGGLCLRPPWSMVEHIGFDASATNASEARRWENDVLQPAPEIPNHWPAPVENPACRGLWQQANPPLSWWGQVDRLKSAARRRAVVTAKKTLPESVRLKLRAAFGWKWFRGDYATWDEAKAASTGYEQTLILDRVLSATRAVQAGSAAYEQDGVLFFAAKPDAALMAAFEEIKSASEGRLRVLDFGGSLGSLYWRHREWLPPTPGLGWDIVEQSIFVQAGRREFANTPLRFFESIAAAEAAGPHDVLLCSTTLQYLEDPAAVFREWKSYRWPWLLLNNLPLHVHEPDRLRVQHVPPSIYPASYPVWFFNREQLLARLAPDYELVREFPSEAVWPVGWGQYPSTGLLLKRKM
ncbi:methyltransferase, TIGR04325 family [Oleiharenicola lentus]|uniref:methyltransferase, TIGR04325 family n=1 Tax=Oleiharenicola lentus TaxID=2508720 RepID=UPI003F680861